MTDQNKTHGVLTDKAAQLIPLLQSFLDRLSNDDRSGLMFEADGDTLRETIVFLRTIKRAPQSPVAPADERAAFEAACHERAKASGRVFEPHYFWRHATEDRYINARAEAGWQGWQARARLADAPTASATEPEGCILIQESDAVPFVHPEYGAGVFFTDDCRLNAAPTLPTSAADSVDAARYRYIWSKVQAVSQNAFLLPHIKPIPGSNLMRGSVAGHFSEAIDAAIAASKESGDA